MADSCGATACPPNHECNPPRVLSLHALMVRAQCRRPPRAVLWCTRWSKGGVLGFPPQGCDDLVGNPALPAAQAEEFRSVGAPMVDA